MIFPIIHALACVALIVASIRWRQRFGNEARAHRSLFPYIIGVGIAAILLVGSWFWPVLVEIFVAKYSGAMTTVSFSVHGRYLLASCVCIGLPFLPVAGIFPAVGRRPLVMACLGLLSLLSYIVYLVV